MTSETTTPAFESEVSSTRDISTTDIQALRESVGWLPDDESVWEKTLQNALHVSSIFEEGKLVGIGFLVGTSRHAVLCDVCVNPDSQSKGLGTSIVDSLVQVANKQGVKYLTLTYAEGSPWLEAMYQKSGFVPIANAMQLANDTQL